jgi:alpha-ribazole phosphatase CobZ
MRTDESSGHSALDTLAREGVTLEMLVECGAALYVPCEGVDDGKTAREIRERLGDLIRRRCGDPNVFLLVEAASHLDGQIREGRWGLRGDPESVVCDELLGICIAEYIGGKKALFNFARYDREKPGVLSRLGVFMDDAAGGLVAGCMTRLFEDWG